MTARVPDPTAGGERRRLSSSLTFAFKFLLPPVWIAALLTSGFFPLADLRAGHWVLLVFLLVAFLVVYGATCFRLKRVALRGDVLRIGNFVREIEVPLVDVEQVTWSLLFKTDLAFLHFRRPTGFGKKVLFMPSLRLFHAWTRWPHPAVTELQRCIEAAREEEAREPALPPVPGA